MTTAQKDKLDDLIQDLAQDEEIITVVKMIEKRIATTKYRYGDYMAFLTPFNKTEGGAFIMGEALKLAGANQAGVDWAVRLLKG